MTEPHEDTSPAPPSSAKRSAQPQEALPLHPIFLKLEGREVLVVGAGRVAERKIAELVEAKAKVHVVAPSASDTVKGLAAARALRWDGRGFEAKDVEGAWLVVAATDDADVQRRVADAAEAQQTFVVAVDDKANASAYGCATLRRGAVSIAISTSGESPALARLIREVLEHALPEKEWIDAARALRDRWRADGTPFESRFAELVKALKDRLRTE
ncbi:MAG: bifunctional precorrin-2 dehydrogenase/sirohydrochlorin ferrochelatase [Polyangiaceae bacterium]|jgi:siroheme synthase-like protein